MPARETEKEEARSFEEAVAFFEQHRDEFLKDYEGKFIALIGYQVVDCDEDWGILARRVYQRYGYREIFMPKVERVPTVVHIPTPLV